MSESESTELQEARRRGDPYVRWADSQGRERVLSLVDGWEKLTLGRAMSADIALTWDGDVSRIHAELVRLADDWAIVDDGLSRNGTFVNGERVERRRRLFDGDEIRVGATAIEFRAPFQDDEKTRVALTPPD